MESRLSKLALSLVTNRHVSALPLPASVAAAVAGGVTSVQLREKDLPHSDLCNLASQIRELLSPTTALFIVNRDLEAAASFAQGVHLGRGAPSVAEARSYGLEIVGVSTHSVAQALAAQDQGASYVFFGPVFQTASKPGAQPQGLEALSRVASSLSIPVVAIGGITSLNATDVLSAGADGVAVVSSILAVGDPKAAAARLLKAIKRDTL